MTTVSQPKVFDEFDPERDALIEASAGTGKTYTLEHLVVHYVLQGTPVDEILVVTFTRRAAGELKARVRGRLEECLRKYRDGEDDDATPAWRVGEEKARRLEEALNGLERATMSTLHGFCEEILQTYGVELGTELAPRHVDEDELVEEAFWEVLRSEYARGQNRPWLEAWLEDNSLSDLYDDLSSIYGRDAVVAPAVDEAASEAAADGGRPMARIEELDDWQTRTVVRRRFASLLAEEVERRKQVEGVMTYDDMIERVHRAVTESDEFVDRIRERYTHALVDEFQDTSPSQWAIFRKLFFEAGHPWTLTMIGDPKQSIYGFRGADLVTYRRAVEEFEADGGEDNRAPLAENYRSTPNFMEAVNPLFGGDGLLREQHENYENVSAAQDDEADWPPTPVHLFQLESSDDSAPNNGASRTKLFAETADEIQRLLDEVQPTIGEDGAQLEPGDIYVLTRSNGEADRVGDELRERGIPHAFYKKDGLFQTDEAEHVRRLLRAAAEPEDRSARRKVMMTPFFDLSLGDFEDYDGRDSEHETARSLLARWNRQARYRDLDTLFERILRESAVIERELLRAGGQRRLTNYRQLFDWLTRKAATSKVGLRPLAEYLRDHIEERESGDDEDDDTQRVSTDRSAVQLLTMHSAKGLSAEVVFVVGGYSGNHAPKSKFQVFPPTPDAAAEVPALGEAVEEQDTRRPVGYETAKKADHPLLDRLQRDHEGFERRETARLYYVAITRAKRRVYLPWVDQGEPDVQLDPLFEAISHVKEHHSEVFRNHYSVDTLQVDEPPDDRGGERREVELPRRVREILDKQPPPGIDGTRFADLRDRTRSIESYSSLTSESTSDKRFVPDDRADDGSTLPPGRSSGDVLHEVLEEMDYTEVVEPASFEEWWSATTVDESIRETLDEHGLDPAAYTRHTGRILFDALRADIEPRGGESFAPLSPLGGLERDRTRREVSFHMPTPEQSHPPLDRLGDRIGSLAVERGYLRGYIDLVFEHDGRLYFADWKGNSRMEEGDYSRSAIETNVRENYDLQAGLYTLAVCRLAGITDREAYRRMGGLFYFYLRGLRRDRPGHGYYFRRPDWSEVRELERRVRRSGEPPEDDEQLADALELQLA